MFDYFFINLLWKLKRISCIFYLPSNHISNAYQVFIEQLLFWLLTLSCWDQVRVSSDHLIIQFNKIFFFFFYFLAFYDSTAEEGDRKQVEREGEWHAAKGPRPGVEPMSAAELHQMGSLLYQLS